MTEREEPAAAISIDGDRLGEDAAEVVRRLIGQQPLDELVQAMLDHEVPPVFLWRRDYPTLDEVKGRVESALRAHLDDATTDDRTLIGTAQRLYFESDPARALLALGTGPGYFAVPESLVGLPDPSSRVFSRVPGLVDRLDNRGLLDISGLDAQPDILFVDDWAIPYHQFLRRGFSSRPNDLLIAGLLRQSRDGLSVHLAIDERRIHRRGEHLRIEERDYWFGPPMVESRLDDPDQRAPEVLVHAWPADKERLPWDNVEMAIIRTSLDGVVRTIEIEELIDPALNVKCEYQLVRYAHAQRDIERNMFIHLDGAVRFYDPVAYQARRAVPWPRAEAEQPVGRRKTFRIDGDMDTKVWADLVACWFRGNELVLEALVGMSAPSLDTDPPAAAR